MFEISLIKLHIKYHSHFFTHVVTVLNSLYTTNMCCYLYIVYIYLLVRNMFSKYNLSPSYYVSQLVYSLQTTLQGLVLVLTL